MKTKSAIAFQGFDENKEVRIYHSGLLPHWRQDGCTYFVTFRLADSLPQSVLRELQHNRCLWLRNHGIDANSPRWMGGFAKLATQDQREYERRMGKKLNESLDAGYGSCVLRRSETAKIVSESLDHFHGERVETGDSIVMPNHVHALMAPMAGFELEDILHSIKSYTANQINRLLGTRGTLWQRDSYDHIVRDGEQLLAFQQYIALNPAQAGLREGEYILSTAEYCEP